MTGLRHIQEVFRGTVITIIMLEEDQFHVRQGLHFSETMSWTGLVEYLTRASGEDILSRLLSLRAAS